MTYISVETFRSRQRCRSFTETLNIVLKGTYERIVILSHVPKRTMEKNSLLHFSGTVEVQKMFLFIDWSKGQFLKKLNQ